MGVPRFFMPSIIRGVQKITGPEASHMLRTLRMRKGDAIELFDGTGVVYNAKVVQIDKKAVTVEVDDMVNAAQQQSGGSGASTSGTPLLKAKIHLGVGMPKNSSRADWIIEKSTEIGVNEIVPLETERAMHSINQENKIERWKRLVIQSCKQCQQAVVPNVRDFTTLPGLLNNFNNSVTRQRQRSGDMHGIHSLKLFGSQHATVHALAALEKFRSQCTEAVEQQQQQQQQVASPSSSGDNGVDANILLLIGPEGDFSDSEMKLLKDNEFVPVSMGVNRLRTETAAIMFLSLARGVFPY